MINRNKLIKPLISFVFFTLSIELSFMAHAENFTQETHLAEKLTGEIEDFWQTGVFSSFQGVDNKRVNFAAFINNEQAPCLVIAPGRSESYLKYKELIFDLAKQPANIFIIDHRGQGLSERLLTNPHKGYVRDFDDYADDLQYFIDNTVKTMCPAQDKPLLLAHSMGGAIAIRLMQKSPDTIKAALLSSPMIAINNGGLPIWLARSLIHSGEFINSLISKQSWYFIAQGDYQPSDFDNNQLMQSAIRFKAANDLYREQPELRLGGVTTHWLQQAITAEEKIFTELENITAPIMVIQASADTVVDLQAQSDFCDKLFQQNKNQCAQGKPINIKGAKHELFFEKDEFRNQALTIVSQWLEQYHPQG